ncbi:MAG TPA: hypothetical protein PLO44_01010 [Candidatus Paceibacterota bacterium]|mgnify:CR=1 FL=1|nr:hypothetical protein [Candidatus Paceibacterota bacterium]
MITKHFWKVLFVFTGIILLGIISSFVVSYLDKNHDSNILKDAIGVAK